MPATTRNTVRTCRPRFCRPYLPRVLWIFSSIVSHPRYFSQNFAAPLHFYAAPAPNLPTKVLSPLLTKSAVDLLINCLTSKVSLSKFCGTATFLCGSGSEPAHKGSVAPTYQECCGSSHQLSHI
jgi:hypothetical protein